MKILRLVSQMPPAERKLVHDLQNMAVEDVEDYFMVELDFKNREAAQHYLAGLRQRQPRLLQDLQQILDLERAIIGLTHLPGHHLDNEIRTLVKLHDRLVFIWQSVFSQGYGNYNQHLIPGGNLIP